MQMPLLVKSSITINGRKFTTMIHEGASAEELIAKVAKENGGGVAKVYYPEFKTHEIVAVKIGDQMIVKGDPAKVGEGDFSEFDNSDSVRMAAVAASSSSKGGIHFFVGQDGIPMAAAENQGIVFPNAQELRVNTNINSLSLAVVDYNVDPNSIRDINRLYKRGARISRAAKEEIEQSHGGVRSEKLMLPDTSVLILSRESGDIRTASEFASKFNAEGFIFKPPSDNQLAIPTQVQSGLRLPTDLGVMHIPLDGSSFRIPYLYVKVFDGKLTDAIKMGAPIPEPAPSALTAPEPASQGIRIPKTIQNHESQETPSLGETRISLPKIETIISFFSLPRPAPQEIRLPKTPGPRVQEAKAKPKVREQAKAQELPSPMQAAEKKTLKEIVAQKLSKSRAAKATGPKAPKQEEKVQVPNPKAKRKPSRKQSKKAGEKESTMPRKKKSSARPKGAKPKKPKTPKAKKPKTSKPKAPKAPRAKVAPKLPKPKPAKKKKAKSLSPKAKPKAKSRKKTQNELVKISTDWSEKPSRKSKRMSKKKKKKIQSYYLNTMLGLVKSKRSGAKNSKRKRKASRT